MLLTVNEAHFKIQSLTLTDVLFSSDPVSVTGCFSAPRDTETETLEGAGNHHTPRATACNRNIILELGSYKNHTSWNVICKTAFMQ